MADDPQTNSTSDNSSQEAINNVLPSQQIMLDVAQKAYQKQLQQHADMTPPSILAHLIDRWNSNNQSTQAAAPASTDGGAPPMSMAPTPNSNVQPGQTTFSPQQIQQVQGLLGAAPGGQGAQNAQPTIEPPRNAFSAPRFDPQTGNIQEGGFVNRGIRGLAGGGIPGLLAGLMGPTATTQMQGLASAQKLKAGQPAEIALPQAEAGEATQRGDYFKNLSKQVNQVVTQGGPPLSPEEKANFVGGLNNLKMQQINNLQDNLQKQAKTSLDQWDGMIKNTPNSQKISDWVGYIKQLRDTGTKIRNINDMMGDVNNALKNTQFINPGTGESAGSPQAKALAQKFVQGKQYKDSQGNMAIFTGLDAKGKPQFK